MSSRSALRRLETGFSLVELLVALAIGLIIIGAALSAYLSSTQASLFSAAESRMNEDAQAALDLLAQQLRMAGNNPKQLNYPYTSPRNPVTQTVPLRGCDTTFGNVTTATAVANLTCTTTGTITPPGSIAVSYEADTTNTTASSGKPTDCVGIALAATTATVAMPTPPDKAVTFYEADNRFYIVKSAATGKSSLYCKGNGSGGSPQPLVENIEDMRLSYGVAPASGGDGTVVGYLSATQIENDNTIINLATPAARWARVVTVRICLIARSDTPITNEMGSVTYYDCNDNATTPSDKYLRRSYFMTVSLRNRIVTP